MGLKKWIALVPQTEAIPNKGCKGADLAEDKMGPPVFPKHLPLRDLAQPDNGSQLSGKEQMKSVVSHPHSLFQMAWF